MIGAFRHDKKQNIWKRDLLSLKSIIYQRNYLRNINGVYQLLGQPQSASYCIVHELHL